MSNRNMRIGLASLIVAVLVASSVLTGLARQSTAFDGNGNYMPPLEFWAQDTNGDGKFNWLWVNVTLDVTVQDVFVFGLLLTDSTNTNTITTVDNTTYFLPGIHTVPMLVEGYMINMSGYDGPYWADVAVTNQLGATIASTSEQMPTAYFATDFERPPAVMDAPFGDHGVDSDTPPDFAFNQFHFSINVTYYEPGTYVLAAAVANATPPATPIDMTMIGEVAGAGSRTYEMVFSGMMINASRCDGPYLEMAALIVVPASGSPTMLSILTNTSGSYLASQFQTRVPQTVMGTVTDATGTPVSGAIVRFLNTMDLYQNSSATDLFGQYSIDLYDGTFLSYATDGSALAEVADRTVSGPSVFDYVLSDLPVQRMDVAVTLDTPDTGWQAMTMEMSMGAADLRLQIDWQMGNRDGYVSYDEQTAALAMMGPIGGQIIGDSWDYLYLDDIFYYPDDYANNVNSYDFTGYVGSAAPISLDVNAHYHSNSTIPSQLTHLLRTWMSYDDPMMNTTYTVNLPPGWIATSYAPVRNVSVTGIGTGTVVVDPLGNPGLPNNFWVNITITDTALSPPIVSNAFAAPNPQEFMQPVLLSAFVMGVHPIATVTVDVMAPTAGSIGNFTMAYNATSHNYDFILTAYPDLGRYDFTVWATDNLGNVGHETSLFMIQDTTNPIAEAGPDQNVAPGGTVTMDGSLSTDNFRVDNWTWDFSDGVGPVTLYGAIASHIFSVIGTYIVTLTVTDTTGHLGRDTMQVRVLDAILIPPTIEGQAATPNPQEYMQAVRIDAWVNDTSGVDTVTVDVLTPTAVSLGNFSMTLSAISGKYEYTLSSYPALGVYSYTIWANDTDGNYANGTGTFRIQDTTNPVADAGPDQNVMSGATVTLNGSASTDNFGVANWTWTFNDGTGPVTLYGQIVSRQFTGFGNHVVTLVARDSSGNTGTDTMNVNVIYPPTPNPPTSVAAAQTGLGQVTVTWVAPTQNTNGSAITGPLTYWVHRATSASGPYTIVNPTAISATQYVDTSVSVGTYYYKVQAENQWHNTSALSSPEAAVTVTDRGSINGTVRSEGQALQGALVEVLDPLGNVVGNATTGADGTFVIGNLPPGQYTIRASKDGYDPAQKAATVSAFARRDVGVLELTKKLQANELPWMWMAIIIVVIAIVLSLLAVLMKKRRKPAVHPGEMPPPPPPLGMPPQAPPQGMPPMQQGPPPQQPPSRYGPPPPP